MRAPSSFFLLLGGLLVMGLAVRGVAASPDDPGARVPGKRYSPVLSGTKSYRPVEPLPWGDVMKRVMPKAKQPEEKKAPQDKQGTPSEPKHKH